jgi:hypothetical protein
MAAQDRPRRRKDAPATARPHIKTSVPLDVGTHAKLCGIAALRGVDRAALSAEFIRMGLRGIVLIDKQNLSGPADLVDRSDDGDDVSDDGPTAA